MYLAGEVPGETIDITALGTKFARELHLLPQNGRAVALLGGADWIAVSVVTGQTSSPSSLVVIGNCPYQLALI